MRVLRGGRDLRRGHGEGTATPSELAARALRGAQRARCDPRCDPRKTRGDPRRKDREPARSCRRSPHAGTRWLTTSAVLTLCWRAAATTESPPPCRRCARLENVPRLHYDKISPPSEPHDADGPARDLHAMLRRRARCERWRERRARLCCRRTLRAGVAVSLQVRRGGMGPQTCIGYRI